MEVLEMVEIAKIAPFTKEDCPFCKPKEDVNEENTTRASYDEDTEADNDTDNSSGTLAKNLKKRPKSPPAELPKIEPGETAPIYDMEFGRVKQREWHQWKYSKGLVPVLYGAHHLIPGNDGLGASSLYKNGWLGPVDNGPDVKNIGYNVNSANNGVWLPGNYAIRPWKGIDPEFQKAYAFLAMHDTNRQFHDSHKVYSQRVEMALNELEKLMNKMKNDGCPHCHEGGKPKSPPYHLNARLNAISQWLRGKVTCSASNWKCKIVTSEWCNEYRRFLKKSTVKKAKKELEKMRKKV